MRVSRKYNKKIICLLIISSLILLDCAGKQPLLHPVYRSPLKTLIELETESLHITPIVLDLPEGHKLGRIELGVVCIPQTDLITIGGKAQVSEHDFTEVVRSELQNANYNVVGTITNSSDPKSSDGELILKGTIKDFNANLCFPKSGFISWKISKGESYVKIYWQLYSTNGDKALFETITEGSEQLTEAIAYGSREVILASVAVATQNLMADKNFNRIIATSTTE